MNLGTRFLKGWLKNGKSVSDLYAYACLRQNYSSKAGFIVVKEFKGALGWKPGSSSFYATLGRLEKEGLISRGRGVAHIVSLYRIADMRSVVVVPDSAYDSLDNFKAFIYALGGAMWLRFKNWERRRASSLDLKDKAYHKTCPEKPTGLTEVPYALSLGEIFTGWSDRTVWKFRNKAWSLGYASAQQVLSLISPYRDNFLHWLSHNPDKARRIVMEDGAAHFLEYYDQKFELVLKRGKRGPIK